jgi:rhodanese-related sulfurtransferase
MSAQLAVQRWPVVLRDAAIVVVLSAVVALGANSLRSSGGIPLVAERPYEILVPCPEVKGKAEAVAPADLRPGEKGLLLVDARESEAFAKWHCPGARSVPFDYLELVSDDHVKAIASSGARRIVVYGDGDNPDSGEQLAQQLSGKGIRNVVFVKGGAPALRQHLDGSRSGR